MKYDKNWYICRNNDRSTLYDSTNLYCSAHSIMFICTKCNCNDSNHRSQALFKSILLHCHFTKSDCSRDCATNFPMHKTHIHYLFIYADCVVFFSFFFLSVSFYLSMKSKRKMASLAKCGESHLIKIS